jgi:hypothetical protein
MRKAQACAFYHKVFATQLDVPVKRGDARGPGPCGSKCEPLGPLGECEKFAHGCRFGTLAARRAGRSSSRRTRLQYDRKVKVDSMSPDLRPCLHSTVRWRRPRLAALRGGEEPGAQRVTGLPAQQRRGPSSTPLPVRRCTFEAGRDQSFDR